MSGVLYNNAAAWPVEDLQRTLEPLLAGITIEVMAEVDSTNSELMRRIRQGQRAPQLLIAERQSAGRGRQGRTWLSHTDPQGQPHVHASLTFSLSLPLQRSDLSGLSLAVGLALAEALHPAIGLKWPNDLWWEGRKLGGILIETANHGPHRFAVIGVGLNLIQPMDCDLRSPALTPTRCSRAWLCLWCGRWCSLIPLDLHLSKPPSPSATSFWANRWIAVMAAQEPAREWTRAGRCCCILRTE